MTMKERDYLFSNFKAFLITMVVLGHFVQIMPLEPVRNFVMLFIYSFHMPAFIFVSGYFSKNVQRCNEKAFESYFLAFIYMSFIYFILRFLITGDLVFRFIVPVFAAWYLLVLFYYKWSIKYLIKIKYIFGVSIVATLISGMIPIINDKYSFGRFISYLPVFLLGYYCSKDCLNRIRKIPKWVAAIVLIAIATMFFWYTNTHEFYYNAFLNSSSYSSYGFTWWQGMLFKSYFLVMAMIMIMCFLILFSDKKRIYSYIGDNTMSVYALHGAFLMIISNTKVLSNSSISVNFLLAVVFTIVVVLLLSIPKVNKVYMLGARYLVKAENRLLYGKDKHVNDDLLGNDDIEVTPNDEYVYKKVKWEKISKKYVIIIAVAMLAVVVGTICALRNNYVRNNNNSKVHRNYIDVQDSSRYVENISDSVITQKDIIYSTAVNYKGETQQLKLDVYEPENDNENNRAAIIWLHGGGLTSGSKDTNELEKNLAIDFAKKGYVTFDVDYRLRDDISSDTTGALKDAMEDAAAAFKWIQENSNEYGVDKNHIAFAGYSSGAVISVNLCYSDLKTYGIDKSSILGVVDLAGGSLYMDKPSVGDPSCIIIHGTKDTTAPYSDSEALVRILDKGNIHNILYSMEGFNHNLSAGYDEINNQITMFLYKELTNRDITVKTKSEVSYEYQKVERRIEEGPVYHAKQIPVVVDGKLDEWNNSEVITLNQIKDTGSYLPEATDFSGSVMGGWNESNPTCVYIAATIVDDVVQDFNSSDGKWYLDDCVEIIFDLSSDNTTQNLMKWVIGATGKDLSVLSTADNTDLAIVNEGNTYYYEMCIDLSKIDAEVLQSGKCFGITHGETIGFSIAYNDGENKVREHQIGWTSGKSSDRATFGNLQFVEK